MFEAVLERTRALVRAYRWRWLDPSHNEEDIPIPALVGPLRYDAFALRDLLLFYLANKDLARDDFRRFLGEARRLRYYEWKFASHAVREPETTKDTAIFAEVFAQKVRESIEVWESMQQRGFDQAFPIEVRVTDQLLPAASGKRVTARYILGDGSHRVACLMLLGYTALPRDHYRLRWYRRMRPFDATWLLTGKGLLPHDEYVGFLSTVYGSPHAFRDGAAFLSDLGARMPGRLEEVRAIMRVDGFEEP